MYSKQFVKNLEADMKVVVALPLLLDELEEILNQPPLPPGHPHVAAQRSAKGTAQATLEKIKAGLPETTRLALRKLKELIDMPPLPPDDPPPAVALQKEIKRSARITLLWWNAHSGPGGRYEGSGSSVC